MEGEMKQDTFQPRDILSKEVAGICGVARMTDKARAAHTGNIGSYKYGAESEQDTAILAFLGISADTFQEAAVQHTDDAKLGAWVLDNCNKSDEEISKINHQMVSWWKKNTPHDYLSKRRSELATNAEKQETSWAWISTLLFFLEC